MNKRKINPRAIAGDIRTGMDEAALMRKYDLSSNLLQKAIAKLLDSGILEPDDLADRNRSPGQHREPASETRGEIPLVADDASTDFTFSGDTVVPRVQRNKTLGSKSGRTRREQKNTHVGVVTKLIVGLIAAVATLSVAAFWSAYPGAVGSFFAARSTVNEGDHSGITRLMIASLNGNESEVKDLLIRGADANTTDIDSETALMAASFKGHTKVVRLLLEHGADWRIRSRSGKTALDHAVECGHKEIARLLRAREAKP